MQKILRTLGIIFVVLGTVMLVTGGFKLERKKKVLDTDVVDVSTKETKRFGWNPYASGAVIIAGLILLIASGKNEKGKTINVETHP